MEALAAPLLSFLAADDERLARFFALTGLDPGGLRAASRSSDFAEALFSYLGTDEPLLLAFAAENELDPADIAALTLAATAPPDEG